MKKDERLVKEIAWGLRSLKLNSPDDLKKLVSLTCDHGIEKINRICGFYTTADDGSHTRYHGFQFTLKNGQEIRVASRSAGFLGKYYLENNED